MVATWWITETIFSMYSIWKPIVILKWVEIDLLIFLLHQIQTIGLNWDKFNPERFCSIHSRLVKDYLYNFSGLVKPSLAHFVPKNLSHTNVWLCLHALVCLSFRVYSIYRVGFCYWYIMVVVISCPSCKTTDVRKIL